jgi:hypothetical protein
MSHRVTFSQVLSENYTNHSYPEETLLADLCYNTMVCTDARELRHQDFSAGGHVLVPLHRLYSCAIQLTGFQLSAHEKTFPPDP